MSKQNTRFSSDI